MSIYHNHHIIPKHMGGTDDPSNLIELTIEEHAEAHRVLYEKHGHKEDYLAWRALSGQIGREEILYERSIMGASQPGEKNGMWGKTHSDEQRAKWSKERSGVKLSEEHKKNMSLAQKERYKTHDGYWTGKHLSEEHRKKLSETTKGRPKSEETRKRMSEAAKKRYANLRKNKSR